MSSSSVGYVQVREIRRRNSLPTYEEATGSVVDRNVEAIESRNSNSTSRIGNTNTNEIPTVIRYYRSDYTDDTPTVIRYYASDYASAGCVLDAPKVIKYYSSDYVAPKDYVLQIERRSRSEQSSKNWSHEPNTQQHKVKPKKLSRVAATASTLQSFKNKVLKIPYLRMK